MEQCYWNVRKKFYNRPVYLSLFWSIEKKIPEPTLFTTYLKTLLNS